MLQSFQLQEGFVPDHVIGSHSALSMYSSPCLSLEKLLWAPMTLTATNLFM